MRKLCILLALNVSLLAGQEQPVRGLTGNLRLDLLEGLSADTSLPSGGEVSGTKSPLLAATLSAIVPGSGEFYSEQYWRAAVFFGAEVLLWTIYATYEGKGDSQTSEFERYGDQYWSVVRYAEWMETHGPSLNPNPPPGGIVTSTDTNLPPWERVDWDKLNAWEQHLGNRASTGFSHRLPRRPDQQYYELIGKYLQYNMGWADWDPASVDYLTRVSDQFGKYRDMRGRANELYSVARTASAVIVVNHLLSVLDAALAANQFNKSLHLEARLQPVVRSFGFVELVPTGSLTISF